MIGQSQAFLETLQVVEKIAHCEAPVLIEGETGTGKELVARAIHYGSSRQKYPFVPVNCGAIPDLLIENELFGHKRGAYTDAQSDNLGLISQAQRGTLFLDEIDALTPKAQVTLLRFLQDQLYRPLGASGTQAANVRIIVASNADLTKLAEQGVFRMDLLFRIKIMYLKLPALRQRKGDAVLLANHFLETCAKRYDLGQKKLHPETIAWFGQYQWPGNIRELENMICREYLLADTFLINIKSPVVGIADRRTCVDRRKASMMNMKFNEAKKHVITSFEQSYLTEALLKAHGNVSMAAKLVGKERRAFGKLLKKYGMDKNLITSNYPSQ
ncbi:sigma-54 dependent transcriptional regulator [Nitrosomonas sp.]|uniref:sigma 54-interacting transcriptional regulator n=1 Tax=Nitrosomonas sp. TaxID=42353 RepID=UPI002612D61D|nr:sigma-54 dependent transcriptional regulator [Nitrosomonas sp.]